MSNGTGSHNPSAESWAAPVSVRVDPSGSLTGWTPIRTIVLNAYSGALRFDRIAIWLTQPERPSPDELLAQRGVSPAAARLWCAGSPDQAPIIADALVAGRAAGRWRDAGFRETGGAGDAHAIVHVLPESYPRKRWWIVILAREDAPFAESESHTVDITMRQVQTKLNQPEQPGGPRALAGHDDQPISTDLSFQQMIPAMGVPFHDFLRRVRMVRDQRWESFQDDVTHDMILQVGADSRWIIFRRTRAVELPEAVQWLIEVRPAPAISPPHVGLLSDPRIARTIGWIHDEFALNPSLEQMADFTHVSLYHFHRVFTRHVGVSPKRYLQFKQLQVAGHLLSTTHLPVRRIASLAGFQSHGHFNAAFHRVTGSSPSQSRLTPRG